MPNDNTTVGKTLKTLIWVAVSAGVMALLSYVTGHKELFNPYTVTAANVLLVAVKNFADPRVRNI